MRLTHLSLANVRTYERLELDLDRGIHVVAGENAAGKSNLLDAVAMLATTRSHRGGNDADLINWTALANEPLPGARIFGQIATKHGTATLEIAVVAGEPGADGNRKASRRFRLNGVARRASDLIGQLRVVMFSADDLTIISGSPSGRRRYLDLTISQFSPPYVRASQRYNRVLQQRNSLLRTLRERRGNLTELAFWDDELAASGAVIVQARANALARLGADAAARYPTLGAAEESLAVCYRPALPDELLPATGARDFEAQFRAAIEAGRQQDVWRGATRIGPHRDDISFQIDGHDASVSASRGQQRTAALALRLSEVDLSTKTTGDPPVLLLDDILSELDSRHRDRILHTAYAVDQVLITTPDPDRPGSGELPNAIRYQLADGILTPI
ncbi:MAG: DNA replication/repair protein RecF [Chloroflexi bacterium]|nr:DNA replication/repair protein RecF [Chloroflexota bacterium]MDA1147289.1 DNA replication/repair protein RecF [Chloroflexota bacterium]